MYNFFYRFINYIYITKVFFFNLKLEFMDINNASGYWVVKKEKIKQKYAILTDEDLHFCEGKEKEMIEMLGYKLGKTSEELRNIIVAL